MAEKGQVNGSHRTRSWLGKLEDCQAAPGLEYARKLANPARCISDIPNSKRDAYHPKGLIPPGQSQSIGLHEREATVDTSGARLASGTFQHRPAEIRADHIRPTLRHPMVTEREVARSRAAIQDWQSGYRRYATYRDFPPCPVDAE
jgi:hypothetical protein